MKEIKGLEERLCGLEQLMVETKKIVQEQNDLTQVHVIFKSNSMVDLTPRFVLPSPLSRQPMCLIVLQYLFWSGCLPLYHAHLFVLKNICQSWSSYSLDRSCFETNYLCVSIFAERGFEKLIWIRILELTN